VRTVLIVDDHQLVQKALSDIIDQISNTQIVAIAENGIQAIALVKQHKPNLMLLDAALPLARGIEVFSESRRWSPETRVALITGFTSAAILSDWMTAGVDGLFLKTCSTEELQRGFELILEGGNFIADEVAELIAKKAKTFELTARERQVLALIARGQQNASIGERLSISSKTVEKHRASLMSKLGVHSVAELLVYALREGMLDEHRQL